MASDRAQILITAVDQTRSALAQAKANQGLLVGGQQGHGVLPDWVVALSLGALVAAGKAALDTAGQSPSCRRRPDSNRCRSEAHRRAIGGVAGVGLGEGHGELATAMVAAGGSKEQIEVFSRLGVSVTDAAGQLRPTEDVLLDLADAFAAMPDGAEKSALAVKLFGKSGVELILNQGVPASRN